MERISAEKIKEIICPYRGELKNEDLAKPLFTLERGVAQAQLEACQQEHERVVREIFKGIWDMFNNHGISVLGEAKGVMDVTVSHKEQGKLTTNVTFSRPAEDGILSWLPDKEWKELKSKYERK